MVSLVRHGTRLRPGGAQILVMTWFDEDDLAARLLHGEDDWDVVNLPAEAEQADPLGRKAGELLWDSGQEVSIRRGSARTEKEPAAEVWQPLVPRGDPRLSRGIIFRSEWFGR